MDLVIAVPALIIALPILAAIALAMRRSGDRGPLLYHATRVGERGANIKVLKVRTMAPQSTGAGVTGADDPRITRVGRVLRRHRLDELPQLINVIRGEMSLVGPRPEDPRFVDWSNPTHRRVFSARPGITGLAQLAFRHEGELLGMSGVEERYRNDVLPQKLELDVEYLDHQSMALDLKILIRTVGAIRG
jgi:lipopolysaccharide/colanic/teichoic acid biosynthesis glycosyltransferase